MGTGTDITNSGERILENENPRLVREHLDRYRLALRYVKPTDSVLDCACGTGYGSHFLSDHVRQVEGVDVSEVAVGYAAGTYTKSNLRFSLGQADALPFKNATFDVYISFETIEHVPDPDALLNEAKRVLKPGGLFILSTPNRVINNLASGQRPQNPFHLFEWSFDEFHSCVSRHFSNVTYFGQRVRSRNKFRAPYFISKVKRALGKPDFVSLSPTVKEQMLTWAYWQPENFVAIIRP